MIKKILCILCIVFNCIALNGGTIDPDNSDKQYLEYGAKHECVMSLMGVIDDSLNSVFKGSCVLISENYALTAAHVVANSLTQFIVYEHKTYPASVVAVHALFDHNVIGKHDIAIIKLQRPIKLDFYPQLYVDTNEQNKICSIAGFGAFGNFKKGYSPNNFDNRKRAGSNIVSDIQKNLLICSIVDSPQTSLEFLICSGDSGGGLFIDNKLAGINSCVIANDGNANSDYGDISGHTRISDYKDWIKNTIVIMDNMK